MVLNCMPFYNFPHDKCNDINKKKNASTCASEKRV